jgi:hypothetical protein
VPAAQLVHALPVQYWPAVHVCDHGHVAFAAVVLVYDAPDGLFVHAVRVTLDAGE